MLKRPFGRHFKGAQSALRLERISSKKKKNYSTRNHFGICPICDVCVFDMDFSNARSAVADGEAADVQISADELFHALRLV